MKIYLDFDGTVVEHNYPDIGKHNSGCFYVIRKLQEAGHEIILNTYRADCKDGTLEEAMKYLQKSEGILRINQFEKKKIDPPKWDWERMQLKQEIFIDDIAENIPLKAPELAAYDIVDWIEIDGQFREKGIY